jgi:hypothetical protein
MNCERPEQEREDETEDNAGGVIQRDSRADFGHGMNLRLAWPTGERRLFTPASLYDFSGSIMGRVKGTNTWYLRLAVRVGGKPSVGLWRSMR